MDGKKERIGWVALPHLYAWRAYRYWSQQELAERAGLSRATIIAAEQGARVKSQSVGKLAGALEIDRRTLVEQTPPVAQEVLAPVR